MSIKSTDVIICTTVEPMMCYISGKEDDYTSAIKFYINESAIPTYQKKATKIIEDPDSPEYNATIVGDWGNKIGREILPKPGEFFPDTVMVCSAPPYSEGFCFEKRYIEEDYPKSLKNMFSHRIADTKNSQLISAHYKMDPSFYSLLSAFYKFYEKKVDEIMKNKNSQEYEYIIYDLNQKVERKFPAPYIESTSSPKYYSRDTILLCSFYPIKTQFGTNTKKIPYQCFDLAYNSGNMDPAKYYKKRVSDIMKDPYNLEYYANQRDGYKIPPADYNTETMYQDFMYPWYVDKKNYEIVCDKVDKFCMHYSDTPYVGNISIPQFEYELFYNKNSPYYNRFDTLSTEKYKNILKGFGEPKIDYKMVMPMSIFFPNFDQIGDDKAICDDFDFVCYSKDGFLHEFGYGNGKYVDLLKIYARYMMTRYIINKDMYYYSRDMTKRYTAPNNIYYYKVNLGRHQYIDEVFKNTYKNNLAENMFYIVDKKRLYDLGLLKSEIRGDFGPNGKTITRQKKSDFGITFEEPNQEEIIIEQEKIPNFVGIEMGIANDPNDFSEENSNLYPSVINDKYPEKFKNRNPYDYIKNYRIKKIVPDKSQYIYDKNAEYMRPIISKSDTSDTSDLFTTNINTLNSNEVKEIKKIRRDIENQKLKDNPYERSIPTNFYKDYPYLFEVPTSKPKVKETPKTPFAYITQSLPPRVLEKTPPSIVSKLEYYLTPPNKTRKTLSTVLENKKLLVVKDNNSKNEKIISSPTLIPFTIPPLNYDIPSVLSTSSISENIGMPKFINVSPSGNCIVNLTWLYDNNAISYELTNGYQTINLDKRILLYTWTNLIPDQIYEFSIRSIYKDQTMSSISSKMKAIPYTFPSYPVILIDFNVDETNKNYIKIVWKNPVDMGKSFITGYEFINNSNGDRILVSPYDIIKQENNTFSWLLKKIENTYTYEIQIRYKNDAGYSPLSELIKKTL